MDEIRVSLARDEALVPFDLLQRWEDADRVDEPEHHAERVALWNLSATLERVLAEPFRPDYADVLEAAKRRLAGDSD